ncbi:MAG: 7TM domain-containing protein [Candidatus Gracilibacteria bacterium]|nr:7TM domain-containing protein [Candidatus Gracilibacteria bacterium]
MKLLLLFITFIFSINTSFGDNLTSTGQVDNKTECTRNKYDIIGDFNTKTNTNLIYSIKNNFNGGTSDISNVSYILEQNGKKLKEINSEKLNISFSDVGNAKIIAQIEEKNTSCNYRIEKNITIYSKIVSYISDKDDLNLSFNNDFKKNDTLFNKIILETKNASSVQDAFISQTTQNLYIFGGSDIVIINTNNYLEILQAFEKLSTVYNINFPNKKIFIVTDSSFIVSKKLLSNFINSLDVSLYTFAPYNLLNFLNYISLGKSSTDVISDKNYGINQISFTDNSNSLFFLTNFTNKLISRGFPISILGIIFSLAVAVTVINFIRQFVGLSIFSLYYPLFFALSIYLFSFQMTLALFVSAIFSQYFMKRVYKKVHFLLNAKLSLFFVLYLIIAIIIIWMGNIFNLFDFNDLKSNLVVFPFIVIPMFTYKIFSDERNIFSLAFSLYLLEFGFVSLMAYLTLKSNFIQNIFLSYTELLILVFFINLMIGKFTGMQFVEYIRFLPLIKKHFQEEE